MAGLIVFLVYFIGYGVSARTYYRRRCGIIMGSNTGHTASAFMPSILWPAMWFLASYRSPQRCTHYSHVMKREQYQQMALDHERRLQRERKA
jgi:hypothetical protein